MCHIYASQDPLRYEFLTKSVRLNGYATSVRLELEFWGILERMAAEAGMGLPKFLATLHDEIEQIHGEVKNFASALRTSCLIYMEKKGSADAVHRSRTQSQLSPAV